MIHAKAIPVRVKKVYRWERYDQNRNLVTGGELYGETISSARRWARKMMASGILDGEDEERFRLMLTDDPDYSLPLTDKAYRQALEIRNEYYPPVTRSA
jgi:hypothetical protein